MELNDIKNIWKKGTVSPNNDKPLTMEAMEALINKRSKAVNLKIRFDIYFSLLLYIVSFGLTIYNTVRYIQSPNLVWILPLLALVLVLLTIQSVQLIPGLRTFALQTTSLRESVTKTISYFKNRYALWQLLFPVGVGILSYNLNIIVDYDPAGFKIYHPEVFIVVYIAMYAIIYGLFRYTRRIYITDLENCLKNLDSQEYSAIVKNIRRSRIFTAAFIIGLLILFLGGLFMFLKS